MSALDEPRVTLADNRPVAPAKSRATMVAACWIPFGVAAATLAFLAAF